MVCEPSAMLAGTVIVGLAAPPEAPVLTVLGEVVSTVPVIASSRRKVIVSLSAKLLTVPVVFFGSVVVEVGRRLSDGVATAGEVTLAEDLVHIRYVGTTV